jgi:hypothetical protein
VIMFLLLRNGGPRVVASGLGIALGTAVLGVLIQRALLPDSTFRTPFTRNIVEAIESVTGLTAVSELLTVATLLVPLCAFGFACAFGAFLWRDSEAIPSADELSKRIQCGRFLLYLFSIMIVIGTIEMRLVLQLPASWLGGKDAMHLQRIAESASTSAGVFASAMLLFICTPVFLILNRRIGEAASSAVNNGNSAHRLEWIKNNGLGNSVFDLIATAGAVVAPAFSNQLLGAIASSVKSL